MVSDPDLHRSSRVQSEFSLCKPPSSPKDIHQLKGLLRNAFTLMAMLDYPYSTHFWGNLLANPVKVQEIGKLQLVHFFSGKSIILSSFKNVHAQQLLEVVVEVALQAILQ